MTLHDAGMLANRVVVLLGTDEIGAGIARRLSREGAAISVLDSYSARAERVVASLSEAGRRYDVAARDPAAGRTATARFVSFPVDFSDPHTIVAAIEETARLFGRIDILVTNVLPDAAPATLENQTDLAFTEALRSTAAAASAMRAAFPFMRAAGGGRIIHVGHRYGETVNEAIAPYNCAAWSLVGLTRTAALDWGQHQITTNLLLPLAATEEFRRAHTVRGGILDLFVSQIPLRRVGDPVEDVGGAALFLASEDACFVNGQTLFADGGQHTAGPVLNPVKFTPGK